MSWVSIILAAVFVMGLSGCGQKGDLYFPDSRTDNASQQAD